MAQAEWHRSRSEGIVAGQAQDKEQHGVLPMSVMAGAAGAAAKCCREPPYGFRKRKPR